MPALNYFKGRHFWFLVYLSLINTQLDSIISTCWPVDLFQPVEMTLVVFVMLLTTIYACEASATHSTVSKWIVARDHEEVARRKSDQLLLAMIVAISSPPWTSESSQSPTQYQSHTEGRYFPNYAPLTKRSEPSSSRPQAGSRRGLSSNPGSNRIHPSYLILSRHSILD